MSVSLVAEKAKIDPQYFALANCITPSGSSWHRTAPRLAVEAGGKFGWTKYVASEDHVIGMTGFGASAPAERLYAEFGITRDAIVTRAQAIMANKETI